MYRSNITIYNDEDFNKVVNAAQNGENELLAVISSGISINVKNKVNQLDNKQIIIIIYVLCIY
jgi:hypothetical protein